MAKKVSITSLTFVVDTRQEKLAAENVLDSLNLDYDVNGTDITINEQLTVDEYTEVIQSIENAI